MKKFKFLLGAVICFSVTSQLGIVSLNAVEVNEEGIIVTDNSKNGPVSCPAGGTVQWNYGTTGSLGFSQLLGTACDKKVSVSNDVGSNTSGWVGKGTYEAYISISDIGTVQAYYDVR